MTSSRLTVTGDSCAIGLSGLCLIHCLILPMGVSLSPILGVWAHAEWMHGVFFLIALPVSLWTLARPAERSWPLVGLAGAGLSLLAAGAAGFPSHAAEVPLTITGAVLLASAHGLNWRSREPQCHSAED